MTKNHDVGAHWYKWLLVWIVLSGCSSEPEQNGPNTLIDNLFTRWASSTSPGCSISVTRASEVIHAAGYGMANLDHAVEIRPNTVFHAASVSKQFTAAAIILLSLEGQLSLDDAIRDHLAYVPDLGDTITIRQLMHHTSGIRDQWDLLDLAGWRYSQDLITNDDVVALFERQKELNFQPGDSHLYSNTGYTLLAQIVESTSGKSLREFTEERIFRPLRMQRTFFRDNFREIVDGQAYGYIPTETGYELSVTNFDTVGATSLMTTVDDLAKWVASFNSGTAWPPAFVSQMLETGSLNDGTPLRYAAGLIVETYRGTPLVEHSGGDAGYRAHLLWLPEHQFSVAILCNVPTDPGQLARQVVDVYLSDQLDTAANDLDDLSGQPHQMNADLTAEVAGLYVHVESEQFVEIVRSEDTLRAMTLGLDLPLIPLPDSKYRVGELPVTIEPIRVIEEPEAILVTVTNSPPREYLKVEHVNPFNQSLEDYLGEFHSTELDATFSVTLDQKGTLLLHRKKRQAELLSPAISDVFRAAHTGTIRYTRNENGVVDGFLVTTRRARRIRFTRNQP